LHRAAYAELGLDWEYTAHDVGLGGLDTFMDRLGPEWAGLSLTMPLKPEALARADTASTHARLARAANTLLLGSEGVVAHNTDVEGMVSALDEAAAGSESALLLGAGATARSALVALAARETGPITVLGRRSDAVDELVQLGGELGAEVHGRTTPSTVGQAWAADLVVSTVPAHAADALVPLGAGGGLLFDVLYEPWPTPLAARWAGPVLGGLDLLVHQAVGQVRLMTGRAVEVGTLRDAGERALQERQRQGPARRTTRRSSRGDPHA
jgi:shikimate dehydrogenase